MFSTDGSILSLIASLIGVTALIFVAKGYVLGQLLSVVFSVLYGIVSYSQAYYGEMITYLGMTGPIALAAFISWMRHPYKDTKEVEVSRLTKKSFVILTLATIAVTTAFYFILKALGTASLVVSTVSIATSFFAASLTFLRSHYYGLAYASNDIVLIVLWVIAAIKDPSYIPMIMCFVAFLINDIYGFINWKRLSRVQTSE
ncbi:MAG: nicotinamide riboside transporter PnuC [Clostridia bacterium]|nr:nicotinamide riboside transporter PnuC [Clostridia bacterium]